MKLNHILFLSAVLLLTIIVTSCKKDKTSIDSYTICCSDGATCSSIASLVDGLSLTSEDSITMTTKAEKEYLCKVLNEACTELKATDELAEWSVVAYPSDYTGDYEDSAPTFEWINVSDAIYPGGGGTTTMEYNYKGTLTFMNHNVYMVSAEINSTDEQRHDGRIATCNMQPERVKSIYTSVMWPSNAGDIRLLLRGCQPSGNLNKGCGWKSKNIYLGILTDNARRRRYPDLNEIGDITGLKLMVTDTENRPETIQKDGITWHICPSFEGNQDLNKWAGGSYLYLYYTTDFTGMQFYLAPAKALQYGTNDPFHRSVYGALCTWTTDIAIKTQDFFSSEGLNIDSNHVYFIPLVDKNFNPDCSEYPANFNHNTKGKNVYISLPYVKVNR